MEFLSPEWFVALVAIILLDLVLAGDNAVVIAIAARKLPPHLQKKAVWAGTAGAIVIRLVLVFFALSLLEISGLRLAGGLLLYWIAWRLLIKNDDAEPEVAAADNFWAAMKTIIVADVVMGLDNILAIAAASRDDLTLVVLGFIISVPIMVGGSFLILRMMQKYPWIITAGCGLLAIVAGRMILDDIFVRTQFQLSALPENTTTNTASEWAVVVVAAMLWTALAVYVAKRNKNESAVQHPKK